MVILKWYNQSVVVFVNQFLSRGVGFLGLIYFTNELGPAGYGVYVLFVSLTGMLGLFTDFGLQTAVEKRVSEGGEGPLVASLLMKFPLLVIISLGIVLFSGWIDGYIGRDVSLFLIPSLLLSQLGRVLLAKMSGELRPAERSVTATARGGLFVGIGAVMLVLNFGVMSLLWGYLLSWFIVDLWLLWRVSIPFQTPSFTMMRSLGSFAKYNFVASFVGSQVSRRMDIIVIGLFMSQFYVGVYQVAWQVSSVVALASSSIGKVIFPHISSLDNTDDQEQLSLLVRNAFTGALIITIPSIFGILLFREEILSLMFGDDVLLASGALAVLLVGRLSQSLTAVPGRLLLGLNRPDLAAIGSVVLVFSNTALNFLLVWKFGIIGAATATTTALILNFILALVFASRFIFIRFDNNAITVIVGASALMYTFLLLVQYKLSVDTIVTLLAVVALGVISYFLLILTYRPFRTRIMNHIPYLV